MTTAKLLATLGAAGVQLWLDEEGQLRFKAPKGALTTELKQELVAAKADIIAFLNATQVKPDTQIPVLPRDGSEKFVLSFAQQRLWFLDRLDPGNPSLHITAAIKITGALDTATMQRALEYIVARHESLRTTFLYGDNDVTQVITPPADWPFSENYDLSTLQPMEQQRRIREIIEDEALRSFDLTEGTGQPYRRTRLFRTRLARLTAKNASLEQHVLFFNMHHIISDGWSTAVLIRELSVAYDAIKNGHKTALPALPIQYADFAAWQRRYLKSDTIQAQLHYWKSVLTDVPTLELPTDFPRPASITHHGANITFDIPQDTAAQLRELASRTAKTLFMVMFATFHILLARYTNQRDFAVGTPIAGRTRSEIEPLIGCFINLLAIRVDLATNPSFNEFLEQLHKSVLAAYENQELPFEFIVDELSSNRNMAFTPIFQTLFTMQNSSTSLRIKVAGLDFDWLPVDSHTSKYDLQFHIDENDGALTGNIEFNTSLFTRATMERMAANYVELLSQICADSARAVFAYPLLTDSERTLLLKTWNSTLRDYPCNKLIHELIEAQAASTPANIAVSFAGEHATHERVNTEHWTYTDLNTRANQIARALIALEVAPDTLIGVCLERSLHMVAALLGVLKAGCAYVPIDPQYPQERTEYVIENAQLKVLITEQNLLEKIPASVSTLCVDRDATQIAAYDGTNIAIRNSATRPTAYAIYTSGSTGKPKGVAIPHQAFVNFLYAMEQDVGITSTDVLLAVTTLSFDIAGLEIFLPLLKGAHVVIASRDDARDDRSLARLIEQCGITFLQATPATWHLLVNSGWSAPRSLKGLCGGEPLPPKLANDLITRGVDVYNVYGPTETTVWSSVLHITEPVTSSSVSIGRPIANTSIFVLDESLNPVPIGAAGELYIGGDGVALGYLGRADLTAERFITNPFRALDPTHSETIYRTGDLARYLPDGRLDCLGRIDNQVKVRGFRIELGEIETILNRHPAVKEGIVHAVKTQDDAAMLVAYIVARGEFPGANSLRTHLRASLPEYMVPSAYIVLDYMPLTPNGKVDRKALPTPHSDQFVASEYVAPCNETQRQLAAIWAEVLGLQRVGIEDNFFELGGHSLLATHVIARIGQTFGIELPLRILFENPTVAGIADHIDAGQTLEAALNSAPEITRADRTHALPLSFAQERLWIIDQFQPNNAAYNIPAGLVLTGPLNIDALQRTLATIVERHEVLRTHFANDADGRAIQVISDTATFALQFTDLRNEGDALTTARAMFSAEAATPFNLRSGPLFRTHLVRVNVDQHVLILNMHHIISDGWSISVLQRELCALYDAFCAGKPSPLSPLALQYADFAAWQHRWLEGTALQRHLDYWVQKLEGAPALLKLPIDQPRPLTQTFNGARYEFVLPAAQLAQVKAFSIAHNTTIYATLLTAFKLTLAQYAHMDDICIGTPVAGRDKAEIRDLIGYFVNTVVVRTHLAGNPTVAELIERVKDASLGAFAHQDVPIEKVLDLLQLERNLSYPPIAQVGFSFINAPMANLIDRLGDISIEPLQFDTVIAKYDMTLVLVENADRIDATVEYNTDLFAAATIARMMRHFVQLLEQCLAHSDWHINNLSMLTHEELCEATGADPELTEKILPLTPMQSDLYLYQQMRPHTRSNQMGYHCELPFALDVDRIRAALQVLADNSTTLRTTIRSNRFAFGEVAYQCIARPAPIDIEFSDRSATPVSDDELKALIHDFIYRPYKLEAEPPVRYKITRLGDNRYLTMVGMHHTVTDGIGCVVHGQAVTNYYTALMQGIASDQLPKIPDNYVDYIFANRAQMDVQAVQDYWRVQYANCDALDFALKERALPDSRKGRGEQVAKTIDIPAAHWQRVETYCKQQKSSPVHYFRSLYGILIKAYCRAENDFAIAEFFAGRDSRAVMMTQGCFFQQTPFIFKGELLGGETRFSELLKYGREFRKDSRKYQAISMSLANRLRPSGRINFMYNYYTFYTRNELMDGHAVSPREHPPYVEQNVQLVVKTLDDHGFLDLYFQDDSFDDLRLLERIVALSQQILDGVTGIRDLTLVLPDEREQQLVAWNQTQVPLPDVASVQAMVERQVAATPDAIAVIDDHASISYRELNVRANRLARYLRQLGVGTDTRVGVCLSRSCELMVTLLGVIKAGGAYVPMDVNYPAERLQYMARDAHAPVVIIEACMKPHFIGVDCTIIAIDDPADAHNTAIVAQADDNPANSTESGDLLYIIYTSGSTGRPKGASVAHRGEINLLNWYVRDFEFDGNARNLIISAAGFDLTQKNLWAPLVSGGAVVLPALPQYDAQVIAALIAQHRVTAVNCAPSAFYGVVEDCKDLLQLASLKFVTFGGEPIRLEKLQRWLDSPLCKAQVVNNYGPTECTDIAAFHRIEQPALYYHGTVPVGRPNDNVQVYIVNDDLQLLPTGTTGELCIGGAGVGRGYLNHDQLNLEKFVSNPFGPGQLYRSGDLMRFDADGLLEFIGRKDFQIKLNGLRIELGEIEYALRQRKGVSDALVTVIDERLVAYVTAESVNIDRSGWSQALAHHLPAYMIPQAIVVLDAWPLTPNGKIDRKALPPPDTARGRPEYIAPRDDTEQKIADILCRVLGLPQVGIHDNFFDLGGHSLAASRAMAQMREVFALDIPLSVLFELTTIEKLADYIVASQWAQQSHAPIADNAARDEGFL